MEAQRGEFDLVKFLQLVSQDSQCLNPSLSSSNASAHL